jgi:hypothetical protein
LPAVLVGPVQEFNREEGEEGEKRQKEFLLF